MFVDLSLGSLGQIAEQHQGLIQRDLDRAQKKIKKVIDIGSFFVQRLQQPQAACQTPLLPSFPNQQHAFTDSTQQVLSNIEPQPNRQAKVKRTYDQAFGLPTQEQQRPILTKPGFRLRKPLAPPKLSPAQKQKLQNLFEEVYSRRTMTLPIPGDGTQESCDCCYTISALAFTNNKKYGHLCLSCVQIIHRLEKKYPQKFGTVWP